MERQPQNVLCVGLSESAHEPLDTPFSIGIPIPIASLL
jgi:hypothetical protein